MKKNLKKFLSVFLALACLSIGTVTAKANGQKGDVDGDGEITSNDAILVLRYSIDLNEIAGDKIAYADYDEDGEITGSDAFEILKYSVINGQPRIVFPEALTYCCGDRFQFNASIEPAGYANGVTFDYTFPKVISSDGTGEPVLAKTNTGRIKAYHPGQVTVTATASNGLTAQCVVTVEDAITQTNIKVGDKSLTVTKHMMLKNDCYNEEDDFTRLDGVVVHSTAVPGVKADAWYNAWNRSNTNAAVHSFLDDDGVYQYLPYDQIGWHAGQPCNQTYLDFEICEPDGFYYVNNVITGYDVAVQQAYFDKIWQNATVYTAYLCKCFSLSPDSVISHAEAGRMGIGTNHGDPDHWFKLHGKNMNDFRNDVKKLVNQDFIVSVERIGSANELPQDSGTDPFAEKNVTPFDMFKVWGDDSLRY